MCQNDIFNKKKSPYRGRGTPAPPTPSPAEFLFYCFINVFVTILPVIEMAIIINDKIRSLTPANSFAINFVTRAPAI